MTLSHGKELGIIFLRHEIDSGTKANLSSARKQTSRHRGHHERGKEISQRLQY